MLTELLSKLDNFKGTYDNQRFTWKVEKNQFDQCNYYHVEQDDNASKFVKENQEWLAQLKPLVDCDDYAEDDKAARLASINDYTEKLTKIQEILELLIYIYPKWLSASKTLTRSRKLTSKLLYLEKESFRLLNQTYRNQTENLRCNGYFRNMFSDKNRTATAAKNLQTSKTKVDELTECLDKKQGRLEKIFAKMDQRKEEMEGDGTIILDIAEDMYCGSMAVDMVSDFTCMLCYGIVMDPIKCQTCNNLVCKKCVNLRQYESKSLECYKKCGSRSFGKLNTVEQAVYDSLVFRCQNDECTERISLVKYRSHLRKKCKVQTYANVQMPQGACSQYDNYGSKLGAGQGGADDLFESDDDEEACPYSENFAIGDLEKLFLEKDERLDAETEKLNAAEHQARANRNN